MALYRFDEARKLIDEAEEAVRKYGIAKRMLQAASSKLSDIECSDKKIPAWLKQKLGQLREAMVYENYSDV